MSLVDRLGRPITYMRISVTDRCNLRCVYCMPPEGVPTRSHAEIMRYEEIAQVVRLAAGLGIRRVRLTGGEPLVRQGLPNLVRMLAGIPEIDEISLTTNAILLEKMAGELKEAGLHRINVSLDTLQPEKYARITRGGRIDQFWRGLQAAENLGFALLKINVVAMRGVNDDELLDLARLAFDHPWHVRFIEMMPFQTHQDAGAGLLHPSAMPVQEIRQALTPLNLTPVQENSGNGPAREFLIPGGLGRVGFITPLSNHFCASCNRLRVTSDGAFRSCLLDDFEVPFLADLRAGRSILPLIIRAIDSKPVGHRLSIDHVPASRGMREIGG